MVFLTITDVGLESTLDALDVINDVHVLGISLSNLLRHMFAGRYKSRTDTEKSIIGSYNDFVLLNQVHT